MIRMWGFLWPGPGYGYLSHASLRYWLLREAREGR
jgi:hypothetical protein